MTLSLSPASQPASARDHPHSVMPLSEVAEQIRITGTVQGVGFRPAVYRIATELGLRGHVCNDGQGVLICLAGGRLRLNLFVARLLAECPHLAKIDCIKRQPIGIETVQSLTFRITPSQSTAISTEIPIDAATCPKCRADSVNPHSRYFRYPFTNCTHCGPRLTIIQSLPYDRDRTSMAQFPMCPSCQREYKDVTNRRFHAQPVACPTCGPQIWLERADGRPVAVDQFPSADPLDSARALLEQGEILAIKGLGGVHLACDATNEAAVSRLRQAKHRYHKPFALMVRDLAVIEPYCSISDAERAALVSPAAPIVLLSQRHPPHPPLPSCPHLAPSIAPNLSTLGVMLPYTPLHHLLLQHLDRPIVMTSGNCSDQPQCITNAAVRETLGKIAPYFLLHNRDIVNRVDDSLVRVNDGQLQILRRARGYAPAPISLPAGFEAAPPVLAMGSELKSTFCLLRSGRATLSQHLGDLEHRTAFQSYQHTLELFLNLFDYAPAHISHDLHPDYLSTKLGQNRADTLGIPTNSVQHHHAHIAACMADNGLPRQTQPVLGIALDGLGYGSDQTLWGGEWLLADYCNFTRLAHLRPIAMIGGTQAIHQPWRNTYAHLVAAFQDWTLLQQRFGDLALIQFLQHQPLTLLNQIAQQRLNSPLASSTGRLFDAVAAALGICRQQATYEGQGAIELEALITSADLKEAANSAYPFAIIPIDATASLVLDPAPMWQSLLQDLQQNHSSALIAARFHQGLGAAIANLTYRLTQTHQVETVALSGGVFQNQILLMGVKQRLTARGLRVLTHQQVPSNDGGLSLGQAVITAARQLDPSDRANLSHSQ